jgi:hypothetical protein
VRSSWPAPDRVAVWCRSTFGRWWPELIASYMVTLFFLVSVAKRGFPWFNVYEQVAWVLLAVLAGTFRSRRRLVRAALHWLPFAAFLGAYGFLANRADDLTGEIHDVSGVDRALFGDIPTVWLQEHLWHGQVRPFDILIAFIYLSHFLSITIAVTLLWARDRAAFGRFLMPLCLLSAAALLTYAVFPAAPPWISSAEGHIPHISRITNLAVNTFFGHSYPPGWDGYSPWKPAYYKFGNPVAAVPSLHAAFPILLVLFFWRRAPKLRWALTLYAVAMFFAVLYLGEHYVIDIVLGVLYAATCFFLSNWIRRVRSQRRVRRYVVPDAHLISMEQTPRDHGLERLSEDDEIWNKDPVS